MRVNRDFLGNPENTMKAELGASSGLIFLQLRQRFSKSVNTNLADISQTTLSETEVNHYLQAISEKVAEQDKAVQAAWIVIQKRLNENFNELDRITTWIDGEEVSYGLELKTSLALVYAALTDKDAFWQEAKKSLPENTSEKETITFRGIFEAKYPKDEKDRLATLWNSFQIIASRTSICHTGVRNEFCMTLNGVYPAVWLIEDMPAFLHDFLTRHLQEQINRFKSDPGLYRKLILAEMRGERSEHLKEALKESEPALRQAIEKACSEHGIKSADFSDLITTYLQGLDDLTPDWGENKALSALSAILAPSFNVDDELLAKVKHWINESYTLNDETHEQQVIDFNNFIKTRNLFDQYQAVLGTWNEDVINNAEIERLSRLLDAYKEDCLAKSSPQPASEELMNAMQQFERACAAFKKDTRFDWVENFFSRWRIAKKQGNNDSLIQLYSDLTAPEMQKKYLVSGAFLDQLFPLTATEVAISPYEINRLFLHAVMVPPTEWTGQFYNYFARVYDYVAEELAKEGQSEIAHALKKSSYPQSLMKQLKYLKDYYQFHRDNGASEPNKIDSFIPMKQFIFNVDDLTGMLDCLPAIQRPAFMDNLSNEFLKNLVNDREGLITVINNLPIARIQDFIAAFDTEFLKTLISSRQNLMQVSYTLSIIRSRAFSSALDNELLKGLIKNSKDFADLIASLSEDKAQDFISNLDSNFLKGLIKNRDDLIKVSFSLSKDKLQNFISTLDAEFLKTLISSHDDLNFIRQHYERSKVDSLIGALDINFFKSLVNNRGDLLSVMVIVIRAGRQDFISSWDTEFLKKLVNNIASLDSLIDLVSENQRQNFIGSLDAEFLKTLITDAWELNKVMHWLPKDQRTAFVNSLDDNFLKNLIRDRDSWNKAVLGLSKEEEKAFKTSYCKTELNSIVNSVLNFCNRPENRTAYGIEKMKEIIKNKELDLPEKVTQIIAQAEWKKSDSYPIRFFQKALGRDEKLEQFYQDLAKLAVDDPKAINRFKEEYDTANDLELNRQNHI